MLDKTFEPAAVEQKHYQADEAAGRFAANPTSNATPHTIMMPPPNVTGSLHMGHALNMTLQDVLTRYRRMQGRDALWQPGTDHAGIATQMVVERQLGEKGQTRHDLGREGFIDRVWAWKEESGNTITGQLRRLGASPDWPRERFTMDEGLSAAVRRVFVSLYHEDLIYKDKRLVNWDPKLHTAISDLEVESKEIDGNLWHFKYPLAEQKDRFLIVATTRPETMLGDTAVAVNPEDDRYKDLIGQMVELPLVGRLIPVVADDYADPETGSGAVKITPAHDFNDFEVGRRHDLEMINIFDQDAQLNDEVPEAYRGLDRYDARKKVIAELEALGLLDKIEPHRHTVPHGDRSGVVIEPWLTDQWYCDAKTLAQPAIKAVEEGRTEFVPKNWENTYYDWMRNIQPWCISRQLWWGHQIPAWYAEDGTVFVQETEAEAQAAAEKHFGKPVVLTRDGDVLDTWFSSALWPFSTIGWPEQTPELARYYPGDVLVTGFDIIFFWVARMMMMGLHFMGDVPFSKVYIHALVRDEKGQKMSKSKGNIIDPLELIEKYGADGLRFTLTSMAAPGRDIKLSEQRVQGYRNFATKLWNATRFCLMNECRQVPDFDPNSVSLPVNRWIVGSVADTAVKVSQSLDNFRYDDAAAAIYQFLWGTFCDWYLEFTKPVLQEGSAAEQAEIRATTAYVLDRALHLLHPVMPFLTEELYEQVRLSDDQRLIVSEWPDFADLQRDEVAMAEIDQVIEVITAIRSARSELNVPPGAKLDGLAMGADEVTQAMLVRQNTLICRLARLSGLTVTDGEVPSGAAQAVVGGLTIALPLADVIDLAAERDRLAKELNKVSGEIDKIDRKLGNEQFMAKAPEAVIDEQRSRRAEAEATRDKIEQALVRIQ
ncbi:MAG: valine--tRNA ligase [Pseudomonadota bacterium]